MKYSLIAQGANVDWKAVTSVRAHFNRLSPDNVSYKFIVPITFFVCFLGFSF